MALIETSTLVLQNQTAVKVNPHMMKLLQGNIILNIITTQIVLLPSSHELGKRL